ncbi:MAG: hypothetical protein IJ097_00595 [Bacilli bacterium]|nr:hypothetical protein [Bacilli bacterium]
MKKEKSGNGFFVVMLIICAVLITLIVFGFIVFINREEEVIEKEENGASIVLNYTSNISGLRIKEATPTTDEVGEKNLNEEEYFDFSVEVSLDNASAVEYEISLVKNQVNSNISNDDIKIYLEKEKSGTYTKVFGPDKFTPLKKNTKLGSKKGSMSLLSVRKTNSTADNYRLRVWLSDKSTLDKGDYEVDVEVNGIAK